MRSSWFIAAVLVALAAAGWALHTLSEPDRRRDGAEARSLPPADREPGPDDAGRSSPRIRDDARTDRSAEPAFGSETADTDMDRSADRPDPVEPEPPVEGGPPPRVEPRVDLAQARADFQAVLDELDQHVAAERHLENAEWVELYKRGNEALVPLQQHLDWKVPEQADELRSAQTSLREKLHAVAPAPALPP